MRMPGWVKTWFVAQVFYTRLPGPKDLPFDDASIIRATRLLPLIGILVGLVSGAIAIAALTVFDPLIAAILATIAGILITGAFHEDGLADSCDGLGGGWDKDQILSIMKDSRIGSYGMIGLTLALLLKIALLTQILDEIHRNPMMILAIFASSHALSRFASLFCRSFGSYAREKTDDSSKASAMTEGYSPADFLVPLLLALIPALAMLAMHVPLIAALLPALALPPLWQGYVNRRIQGYTGDTLGTAQQLSELVILGVIAAAL